MFSYHRALTSKNFSNLCLCCPNIIMLKISTKLYGSVFGLIDDYIVFYFFLFHPLIITRGP